MFTVQMDMCKELVSLLDSSTIHDRYVAIAGALPKVGSTQTSEAVSTQCPEDGELVRFRDFEQSSQHHSPNPSLTSAVTILTHATHPRQQARIDPAMDRV